MFIILYLSIPLLAILGLGSMIEGNFQTASAAMVMIATSMWFMKHIEEVESMWLDNIERKKLLREQGEIK